VFGNEEKESFVWDLYMRVMFRLTVKSSPTSKNIMEQGVKVCNGVNGVFGIAFTQSNVVWSDPNWTSGEVDSFPFLSTSTRHTLLIRSAFIGLVCMAMVRLNSTLMMMPQVVPIMTKLGLMQSGKQNLVTTVGTTST